MKDYFSNLKLQANKRAQEASLSVLGINNPSLRNHLSKLFTTTEPFVHGPVLEQTFAWEQDKDVQMSDLVSEGLLSPEVVNALDADINGRYAFKADWYPFTHQLSAWRDLLNPKAQSRIITSGTGSGKTECFMVPVLEDLLREVNDSARELTGVRALFLYPLNALINSQKERLNAWTQHFNGDIRFCLFNGNTPNDLNANKRKIQKEHPQEVLSRNLMRDNPAQILVTNGTMLEYMLVRQADAPIIEKSKGKLRWIILDEAHTYVGSQAAELALQLRRVMQAFEVEPKNVRFVATSATIAGEEAETQLKTYLSELAGVDEKQVAVIGGQRAVPKLPTYDLSERTLSEIQAIVPNGDLPPKKMDQDPHVSAERYQALCESSIAKKIRGLLTNNYSAPMYISELMAKLAPIKLTENELYQWLDVCTGTKASYDRESEAFLKLRAHYFQRTLNGLWSCIDPNCPHKKDTQLAEGWPFGYVYTEHRQKCTCGALVLELAFCNECNEPHLLGVDRNGELSQWTDKAYDEFSLLDEGDREFDETRDDQYSETPESGTKKQILGIKENDDYSYFQATYDAIGKELFSGNISLTKYLDDGDRCCECGFSGIGKHGQALRRGLLGAPFYTTNAVPTVLEYCPDIEKDKETGYGPLDAPGRGRRLITFTDSRQGTAKMSVQMQQEAERSRLRGLVFKELRKYVEQELAINSELLNKVHRFLDWPMDDIKDQISLVEKKKPQLASALAEYLTIMESGASNDVPVAISWRDLADSISKNKDLSISMLWENHRIAPEIFDKSTGPMKLANMLLTREFARRPKFKNNLETQGLVKFVYPEIEKIKQVPEHWENKGLTLSDWKDFLKISLDFFVRENTYILIDPEWRRWIGMNFASKTLIAPDSTHKEENRAKKWPQIKKGRKIQQRLITLLCLATDIDISKAAGEQIINDWLKEAWKVLTSYQQTNILQDSTADKQYSLDLSKKAHFALLRDAYICPITHKILDTTFKGFTPYIPGNVDYKDKEKYQCRSVKLPPIWEFTGGDKPEDAVQLIRDDVQQSPEVQTLREQNLWTDINDRTVEGGFYYVTAEHSAQQSAERLTDYEDLFKEGKKNVLNCSTTMEMGVDIGGITAVVMNNVPPHPANYLQRAGRAGRSKESRALSYTLCKNNPHDTLVFNNPKWPFTTRIPAPHVEFSSQKLVWRHVNSFLLGRFLIDVIGTTDKEKINLNLEWFYYGDTESKSIAQRFINWILSLDCYYLDAVEKLVKGTALSDVPIEAITKKTAKRIEELSDNWISEYDYIEAEFNNAEPEGPYAYKLENEKSRLCREYLLKDLATKAFLPGYGFPTDVVTIDTDNVVDYIREKQYKKKKNEFDREDNVSINRGLPSRNLSVAIREYAPGSEIVLDGRVHRSAGISLNWQKLHLDGAKDVQKFDMAWRCPYCGQTGYETNLDKQSSSEQLICSNSLCNRDIPNSKEYRRKVIQPSGFVTDYYREPTNNVAHQSYVPVQTPWVSVDSAVIPLPTSELGYMRSDPQGKVFYYSSGLNGNGYALCLACGRAESMTAGDELPKALSIEKPHKPPRPSKFAKDENDRHADCDGSAKIMENIYLGVHSQTDVFELVLRNPTTGEYIPNTDDGKIIATTLAVALRKALTQQLGISINEVGYSKRDAIEGDNQKTFVLQLFDSVSGGAGFATSARDHISLILAKMVNELHCSKECSLFCPNCLLESDSRHDADKLDRQKALAWLGDDFINFIDLPNKYKNLLVGAEYCPTTIKEQLTNLLNNKIEEIRFVLSPDPEMWDISINLLKSKIHALLASDIRVILVLPDIELSDEIQQFLSSIQSIGATLCKVENSSNIVFQANTKSGWFTLANLDEKARTPGKNWLCSDDLSVVSMQEPALKIIPLELENETHFIQTGAVQLEIKEELNGRLDKLGEMFKALICETDNRVQVLFENQTLQSVHYSDRYLQNPAAVMLLSEVIKTLVKGYKCKVTIDTCFDEKHGASPRFISHDWHYQDDFKNIFTAWITSATESDIEINMVSDKKSIYHRRAIELYFDLGDKVQITLDQGFGYWWLDLNRGMHFFDFDRDDVDQVKRMLEVKKDAKVKNSANWPTFVVINVESQSTQERSSLS